MQEPHMPKERLLAFSDGVIAIIITIMVLELKAPNSAEFSALLELMPVFLSYLLSFVYVAIYWNNHHHMLHTVHHVTGTILWANTHLLFWLSLIPFATAWMGRNNFTPVPTAIFGIMLFMAAIAYFILQLTIIKAHGEGSILKKALGNDLKGKISAALYLAGIGTAFIKPWIACILYAYVAVIWLVPDRRIERALKE